MKKNIIFLALFSAIAAQAQFKPKAAVDYFNKGYRQKVIMPLPTSTGQKNIESIVNYGEFRLRMGAEYKYKDFSAYLDQNIYMDKASGVTFTPLQAEWFAGLKVEIKKGLFLKYEHYCIHPIETDGNIKTNVYGGYDLISLSYGY